MGESSRHNRTEKGDRFESQQQQPEPGKKRPWYHSFGKEVLINGLTIMASIAGGMVGGVWGAIAAGSLTSGALGIADQKLFLKQKLDWNSVAIDAALGLIPGTLAESVAKGGSKALGHLAGKSVGIGAKDSLKRGVIVGATDGVVMGSVGGLAQSTYDSYKKEGRVNWADASKDGVKSMLPAVVGGSLGAGVLLGLRNGKLFKSGLRFGRRRDSGES